MKTIKDRTQGEGKGVKTFGGRTNKLKPLAESTIRSRKAFKGLSSKTSPTTSNLTFTGQLVESIRFRIQGIKGIEFFIDGDRNKKVAEYVKDRSFFTLSKSELNKLAQFFKNLTRR